jgi:hypothetical protein
MSDAVLAALITGVAGLISGALAVYFAQRRHNQTIAQTARETAQRREDEAHRTEEKAQRREEEARRQAEQAHRREAVAYLKLISTTISGMREQLADESLPDEKRIPHKLGNRFIGLLESYKDYMQPYLGEKTSDELEKLTHRVHDESTIIDNYFYSGQKPEPEHLSDVLADMERVEGHVEAQAARISPTESRAD